MRTPLRFLTSSGFLIAALLSACSARTGPEGVWAGSAKLGDAALQLQIALERGPDGHWTGSLSSDDLMLLRVPLRQLQVNGREVTLQFPDADVPLTMKAVFTSDTAEGTAGPVPEPVAAGLRLRGIDPTLRLRLRRLHAPPSAAVRTQPVRFRNGNVSLRGEIFLPEHRPGGKSPGVVLLQGSASSPGYYYRYYADYFARRGIASLVFDKRGSGASEGDYDQASYEDLKNDALAAVRTLQQHPGVDNSCVGVWGLSQGGFIGAMVAAEADVSFFVAVSATGMPAWETAAWQDRIRVLRRGFTSSDADAVAALHAVIAEWAGALARRAEIDRKIRAASASPWRTVTGIPGELPPDETLKGWYWGGRILDPALWWARVKAPVLLVYGDADDLVPPRRSAARIGGALRRAGNRSPEVRFYPGADHLIRLSQAAGGPEKPVFGWPRQTPGYLSGVAEWMRRHGCDKVLRSRTGSLQKQGK